MNPTTPEKCPKCGASLRIPLLKEYQCDSLFEEDDDGWFLNQSYHCFATQRDQLAERVKRLEDAGDRMAAELNRQCAPHWEDSLARLWRAAKTGVRPVDQVEASACAVIQDVRRGES